MTRAILFDMDGTLVDSEPLWDAAISSLARSHGIAWTADDARRTTGMPMIGWATELHRRGVPGSPNETLERVAAEVAEHVRHDVPWLPGARELLAELAARGVPTGLVTNARRVNAEPVLRGAPKGSLTISVTSSDVAEGKPHPEPYLRGATLLGVDPAACIAFEDSVPGSRSAADAGMTLWFVASHLPGPGFPVARTVATLADVDIDALLAD